MRLAALIDVLAPLTVTGSADVEVRGVSYNSQTLQPGDVFVAVAGAHVDGHRFVADAASRGAAAAVVERAVDAPPGIRDFPMVTVADTRLAVSQLADQLAGRPSQRMWLAGITGTDGKTTSTELAAQLLRRAGVACGFMSTVTLQTAGEAAPNLTRQTTLEAVEVHEGLAAMLEAGRTAAILEVTSHALALRKVEQCAFDVAGVTNVTHEHLDLHGSREGYVRAKGHLFELLAAPSSKTGERVAILNRDDRSYDELLPFLPASARALSYALAAGADVVAEDLELRGDGSSFVLRSPWGSAHVELPLIGRFNVSNALLAASVCFARGLDAEVVAAGLAEARAVSGRMERIDAGQPFGVVVDYAHTPDSLEKVLAMLRQSAGGGRVIAVFGSAGERDVEKRPIMGAVAAKLADFSVFTTEDPRFEDPMAIIEQIARGAAAEGKREGRDFLMVEDRRAAIAAALDRALPGDLVLLAGKGHEQCIIVGNTKVPWDDRAVARELVRSRYSTAAEP